MTVDHEAIDLRETMTVGAQLRRIRLNRGLSLEVVAGLAGFSAGFLSRVERGELALDRLTHWRGISDALGIPLPDLLRLPVPSLEPARCCSCRRSR
ncbi:MAG: helix-turn-helix domain-containing protein [Pseudonocardiaceae bacterium]